MAKPLVLDFNLHLVALTYRDYNWLLLLCGSRLDWELDWSRGTRRLSLIGLQDVLLLAWREHL